MIVQAYLAHYPQEKGLQYAKIKVTQHNLQLIVNKYDLEGEQSINRICQSRHPTLGSGPAEPLLTAWFWGAESLYSAEMSESISPPHLLAVQSILSLQVLLAREGQRDHHFRMRAVTMQMWLSLWPLHNGIAVCPAHCRSPPSPTQPPHPTLPFQLLLPLTRSLSLLFMCRACFNYNILIPTWAIEQIAFSPPHVFVSCIQTAAEVKQDLAQIWAFFRV